MADPSPSPTPGQTGSARGVPYVEVEHGDVQRTSPAVPDLPDGRYFLASSVPAAGLSEEELKWLLPEIERLAEAHRRALKDPELDNEQSRALVSAFNKLARLASGTKTEQ